MSCNALFGNPPMKAASALKEDNEPWVVLRCILTAANERPGYRGCNALFGDYISFADESGVSIKIHSY
jgi:hypothetical protein